MGTNTRLFLTAFLTALKLYQVRIKVFFSKATRRSVLHGTRFAASDGHKIWFVDWHRSHGPALAGMGSGDMSGLSLARQS